MDKKAIEAIRENSAFDISDLNETDQRAIVIPESATVESLEFLMDQPNRFKANFNTHIPKEFISYCQKNIQPETAIYIDTENMQAHAIFDHGSNEQPQWADHNASLQIIKKPAYEALINKNNRVYTQQDLIDFLNDWKESVTLFDVDDQEIPYQTAINRIRKLTISTHGTVEKNQGDFNHTASAMESVEIKSGEDKLPAYFTFSTTPYESFENRDIHCQLRAKTDGKEVSIKYRIEGLEVITEQQSNEFKTLLQKDLPDESTIYIGKIKLR